MNFLSDEREREMSRKAMSQYYFFYVSFYTSHRKSEKKYFDLKIFLKESLCK